MICIRLSHIHLKLVLSIEGGFGGPNLLLKSRLSFFAVLLLPVLDAFIQLLSLSGIVHSF